MGMANLYRLNELPGVYRYYSQVERVRVLYLNERNCRAAVMLYEEFKMVGARQPPTIVIKFLKCCISFSIQNSGEVYHTYVPDKKMTWTYVPA